VGYRIFFRGESHEAVCRGIEMIIPDQQFQQRNPYFADKKKEKAEKKRYGAEDFTYNEWNNIYKCPCGKALGNKGYVTLRAEPIRYFV
jgi:hypothetical protein